MRDLTSSDAEARITVSTVSVWTPLISFARLVIVCCALGLSGCQTLQNSRHIQRCVCERVTEDEARRISLAPIDRVLAEMRAEQHWNPGDAVYRDLIKERARQSAKLDAFFVRFKRQDECWLYRTYLSVERGAGESGLARVRGHRVVDTVVTMVLD